MWGQTISPGSPPFKSHMYICCTIYIYSVLFLLSYIVHRKKKLFLFLPKGRAFVTMYNVRNNRISDGCVYAQIRKGLGMHLVTYMNRDTVPFLLIVHKRAVCLRWNSLCLYLVTLARFRYFS